MSIFGIKPDELRSSAQALRTASGQARGADAADAISSLGGALSGSSTATVLPQFAKAWDTGIKDWARTVDDFAEGLEAAATDAESADEAVRSFQQWLERFIGGGS